LFPTVSILLELKRRGHDVLLFTLRDEVERVAAERLRTHAISEAVEAIAHDDYDASSPRPRCR
jgi:UDP:flavonoid glycosyltransferase YjiC (YdhE family)